MGEFLTQQASMMCPHGGTVSIVPADPSVTFGGAQIALATDTFLIAGCGFTPGTYHPCVQVQWQVTALRSQANGSATLTTDSVGMCVAGDMAVQGTVIITATQTKASGL